MVDSFMWIIVKHEFLRRKMKDPKEDTPASYQFKVFEREVLNQVETLVEEDAYKSVGICDSCFNGNHHDWIMRLHASPQTQYKYVKTVIEHMKDHIMKTVTEYQSAKS